MKKVVFILFIFCSVNLLAQMSGSVGMSDPRSMSMGKSSVISSFGVYAIQNNPGNMVLYQGHSIEIATLLPIPNASLFVGNDMLSVDDYNYFFGGVDNSGGERVGRFLNDADKERLLNSFSDGETHSVASSINLFSISFKLINDAGALGFSITDVTGERGSIPKDLVDLYLFGNTIGRNYSFADFDVHSFYLREYAISYSKVFKNFFPKTFKQFSAGITLKLVHGYEYTKVTRSDISVVTLDDYSISVHSDFLAKLALSEDFGMKWDFIEEDREFSFTPFPSPAGVGFGFNLGFNAKLSDALSMALALTDVGSVNWENEVVQYSSSGDYVITDVSDSTLTDTLEALIKPTGEFTDGFSTNLPTALRFGMSVDYKKMNRNFKGELVFIFGYAQGFNNEPTNTTNPRFSIGAEWKPSKTIPIRTGFSFGGINKFEWGLGFGLDFGLIEMNFGTSDLISLFQWKSAKRNILAFGSRWKF